MQEYLDSVNYQPHIGRFRPEQIAQRSSWARVPDEEMAMASLNTIHVVPTASGSTVTTVNPMDPGDGFWLSPEHGDEQGVVPAGGRL